MLLVVTASDSVCLLTEIGGDGGGVGCAGEETG